MTTAVKLLAPLVQQAIDDGVHQRRCPTETVILRMDKKRLQNGIMITGCDERRGDEFALLFNHTRCRRPASTIPREKTVDASGCFFPQSTIRKTGVFYSPFESDLEEADQRYFILVAHGSQQCRPVGIFNFRR